MLTLPRIAAPLVSALALVLVAAPALAAPPALTAEEFKLYKEYVAALDDERVKAMPEAKRLAAIAKNFKVPEKVLAAAIEKGKAAADAAKQGETEIRTLADASALKGLVTEVKVDDTESHAVAYVAWKNLDGAKLEEEASLVALLAAEGAPFCSTVALWATDAAGRKVFEAKIRTEAAAKFSRERIAMFATKRYINVFEDVRNAYKGTPPAPN